MASLGVLAYDDRGKIAGFATGSFGDYCALIEELASARGINAAEEGR